jgi:hypothetical protein
LAHDRGQGSGFRNCTSQAAVPEARQGRHDRRGVGCCERMADSGEPIARCGIGAALER